MPPAASNLARLHVETLFTVHSIFSGLVGSVSFLLPHVGEFFLVPHGEKLKLRDNANREDQVPHLIIRLLGALLLSTALLSYLMRRVKDPEARRAVVRANFVFFSAAALALLRAQLVRDSMLSAFNWVNILIFGALAYNAGYYAFVEPAQSFSLPTNSFSGRLV
jgi:hypothetical protein